MPGLPDDPHISAFGRVLEGLVKPLALAGIALAVVAGFLHWVIAGPNEVQPEDEAEAKHCSKPSVKRSADDRTARRTSRHDATKGNADPQHAP